MKEGRISGLQDDPPANISGDVYRFYEINVSDMENAAGLSGVSMGRTPTKNASATEIHALERAGQGRVGMASALFDEFVARLYYLMAQEMQKHYDIQKIVRVLGESGMQRAITISQKHKTVKFDVEVEAGSTLPYDKEAKKVHARELFGILGVPYLPDLLDAYEVRNKDEMLQKHQEYQMFLQYAPLLQNPQVQAVLNQYAAQMQAAQGPQQAGQNPQPTK